MLFAVGGLESADLSPDHCELYVSWQAIPWDGQVHTSVEECMAVQGLSLISVCMIGLRREQNILSPRRMFRRRFTCFCLCTDIVISFLSSDMVGTPWVWCFRTMLGSLFFAETVKDVGVHHELPSVTTRVGTFAYV